MTAVAVWAAIWQVGDVGLVGSAYLAAWLVVSLIAVGRNKMEGYDGWRAVAKSLILNEKITCETNLFHNCFTQAIDYKGGFGVLSKMKQKQKNTPTGRPIACAYCVFLFHFIFKRKIYLYIKGLSETVVKQTSFTTEN